MQIATSSPYETYRLTRIVSIYAIVSADYVSGIYTNHSVHNHEQAWELCYCINGEATICYNHSYLTLQQGQCLLIPPNTYHNINLRSPSYQAFVISFTCMDAYLTMLREQTVATSPRQQQQFQQILSELRSAFSTKEDQLRLRHFNPRANSPLGAEQLICCYLEEILIEFLRTAVCQETEYSHHKDLETAVQSYLAGTITAYIRAHLGEDLSVEQLAQHFHYSRNRIGSLYKNATGISLGRAIIEERIAQAKVMLAAQENTITEISYALGFSSPQYFCKSFSKETGYPPSVYAEHLRQAESAQHAPEEPM